MRAIYEEVKTPFKYGIVIEPPEGKKVDCPTVFRYRGRWYMVYVQFEPPPLEGYTTQLAESDLVATLPRRLVERHAARFNLVTRTVPLPWVPDPVRVVASRAAMADAGIAWLFETMARCFGSPTQRRPRRC